MLEFALQYSARGWRVFPVHTTVSGKCSCGRDCGKDAGKHPRIKAWQDNATTDVDQITRWWTKWPDANIGVATGAGLVVIDVDGPEEMALLRAAVARYGPFPPAPTVRTGRGIHLYYQGDIGGSRKIGGLLFRGNGGYVIAPPSFHPSGRHYQWVRQAALHNLPDWIEQWAQDIGNKGLSVEISNTWNLGQKPAFLQKNNIENQCVSAISSEKIANRVSAALATPWNELEYKRIREALKAIPADIERDPWLHIGMSLHELGWERPDGSNAGMELWLEWSQTAKHKFQGIEDLETRWRSFGKPGREKVQIGTLFHIAQQHGWQSAPIAVEPPKEKAPAGGTEAFQSTIFEAELPTGKHDHLLGALPNENGYINGRSVILPQQLSTHFTDDKTLIDLNKKYSVIGDVGGKCLVLGWVPSKVDETVLVPSFQTHKSFTERYANKYVSAWRPKGDQWVHEMQALGGAWLKWSGRAGYEGIDLVPAAEPVLPGNVLNLWKGFAIVPRKGGWNLMRRHIAKILARGDIVNLEYILKWAAWKVQHPGERAETALVFKGAKGSGKGTFANALRRMFGQHGLQIFNSKHLVGSFNGHLRNCLLLFADEAFWAGDKHGESVLKGMLTEPALMIEQKGVDATPWKNRLGVIMAANAEWVVPASHDERRYAVFDVSQERMRDREYFKALYAEMMAGGLEAMLWDLQNLKLGDFHPRQLPQTEALQQQKLRSLAPLFEWYEALLSDGVLSGCVRDTTMVPAALLLGQAREAVPRLRDVTATALGRMLAEMGAEKVHTEKGSAWKFKELTKCRAAWVERFGAWKWSNQKSEWMLR